VPSGDTGCTRKDAGLEGGEDFQVAGRMVGEGRVTAEQGLLAFVLLDSYTISIAPVGYQYLDCLASQGPTVLNDAA
jgi:hypothetical protein